MDLSQQRVTQHGKRRWPIEHPHEARHRARDLFVGRGHLRRRPTTAPLDLDRGRRQQFGIQADGDGEIRANGRGAHDVADTRRVGSEQACLARINHTGFSVPDDLLGALEHEASDWSTLLHPELSGERRLHQ